MSAFYLYKHLAGVPLLVHGTTRENDALKSMVHYATYADTRLRHREHMILVRQDESIASVIAVIDRRDCDLAGEALVLSFEDGREIWADIKDQRGRGGLGLAGDQILSKLFDAPTEILSKQEIGF